MVRGNSQFKTILDKGNDVFHAATPDGVADFVEHGHDALCGKLGCADLAARVVGDVLLQV